MDRLLRMLASRGLRRGLGGEPVWLALGVLAWLVHWSRQHRHDVLWSGRVGAGQRLVISAHVPGEDGSPVAG